MSDLAGKMDPALRRRLSAATADEPVAAILELEAPPPAAVPVPLGGTAEATERRRAARTGAAEALARHTGGTIVALERLGVAPRGGRHIPFVVVSGTAAAIRAAIELPGVASAALDAPPDRPTRREDER